MIRVLAMISVAGFILSVVCLSVAVSMAGPELVSRGAWAWTGPFSWSSHDYHHSYGLTWRSDGPETSRQLAWSGGDTLEIGLPAEVSYVQAAGPAKLLVRGPENAVRHVRVAHGRIEFDRPGLNADNIIVELSAPNVSRFVVSGDGRLGIRDYNQPTLSLQVSGDGQVQAAGAAKTATVEISGAGDADLAGLQTDGAEVTISGAGEAKVAPKAWAKLTVSGSGDITLLSHPRRLESQVSGSGRIEQAEADREQPAEASPAPAKRGKSI
jgi:hypothetical protein